MLDTELIKGFIDTNYNRYFTCADIVNEVIKDQYKVSWKHLKDSRKLLEDPFDEDRRSLTIQVSRALTTLRQAGHIEKYSRRVWRIME